MAEQRSEFQMNGLKSLEAVDLGTRISSIDSTSRVPSSQRL